ncbi:MAG: hypothetical protein MHM6MM_000211 [Cercozoa sp. M6MM]
MLGREKVLSLYMSLVNSLDVSSNQECADLARSWVCLWLVPRVVQVELIDNDTRPLAAGHGAVEFFRQPICMSTCEYMFAKCPEIPQLLVRFKLSDQCKGYTFSDSYFNRRWSEPNRFLRQNEHYEAFARPSAQNVTDNYVRTDPDDWGNSSVIFSEATRVQAWQNDSDTAYTPFDVANMTKVKILGDEQVLKDEQAYASQFGYSSGHYFVRSVDGGRHEVPCAPIRAVETSGSAFCGSDYMMSVKGGCDLVCPTPFLSPSENDSLIDTRIAAGWVMIVCTLLVLLRLFFDNARHKARNARVPLLPPFPARLAVPLSISFLLVAVSFALQPDTCASDTEYNSSQGICKAQAFLFVSGAVSTVAWWCTFAVCLCGMLSDHRFFTTLGKNREVNTRRLEVLMHSMCWLPAFLCGILPVALDRVRWNEGASMCAIDTKDGVALFVAVLVVPFLLCLVVGAIAVIVALAHVVRTEKRLRRSSSATVVVARFAMFVPCFLATAVITLVLEVRRLGIPGGIRDAKKAAVLCATDMSEQLSNGDFTDFTRIGELIDSCVSGALDDADTGISFGAEIASLTMWMLTCLVVTLVFAVPLRMLQRCIRRRRGQNSSMMSTTPKRQEHSRTSRRTNDRYSRSVAGASAAATGTRGTQEGTPVRHDDTGDATTGTADIEMD